VRGAALACLALVACGKGTAPRVVVPSRPAGAEKLDPVAAAADLRIDVLDGYRLLSQGYDSVYLEAVSRQPKLVLIDVEPGDVVVGDAARAAGVRVLVPGARYQLVSKELEVRVCADGTCALVHDDLSYRVELEGRRGSFPLRATSVFEREGGRWLKVLEHVSYPLPLDAAPAEMSPMALPPSVPEGEDAGRARDLVLSLANVPGFRPPVFDHTRVVSMDGRERRGAAAAELASIPTQVGEETSVSVLALRVELSRGGGAAWAAAQLELRGPRGSLPARATWALEKQDGVFRLAQAHLSIPVPGEHVVSAVYGAPLRSSGPP
jgi:hypothetical protein